MVTEEQRGEQVPNDYVVTKGGVCTGGDASTLDVNQ